uniref:Large ribosomal subunit protein mL49 n=1 Tax=Caenorhabditis japonica TaxID=281687 RepID=A0A8R1HQC9_CAEJA
MLCSSLRRLTSRSFFSTSALKNSEKVWENPWKHAIPERTKTLPTVEEISVDWSYVERLMPIEVIPEVPKHESYPTPSGWTPPTELGKTHPYFVRRRPDHMLPLYLERKRDLLNENTLDFDYVELVTVKNIDGDLFVSFCKENGGIERVESETTVKIIAQ